MPTNFDGGVSLGSPPCPVATPAAWRKAVHNGYLWRGVWDTHSTDAPAPDGAGVLHQTDTGTTARIELLGAGHKVVQTLGTIPNPYRHGQIGFNMITKDYGAFVFHLTNGDAASFMWRLYLWNRRTGQLTLVAHYGVDSHGYPLQSGWVQPVLADGYLYWIQALPRTNKWGTDELRQYSLATGKTRVLYHGLTTVFGAYQGTIVLNEYDPHAPKAPDQPDAAPMSLYQINPATGVQTRAPASITLAVDSPDVNAITSEGDLLVWATNSVIQAWRPAWGKSITLVPDSVNWATGRRLGINGPTYVRLYKDFLVWNPGGTWVLDLTTGTIARLDPGRMSAGEDASGSVVSLMEYASKPTEAEKDAGRWQFDQILVDISHLPHLPACR